MDTEDLKRKIKLTPTQTLVIGIIIIILVGAIILKMPICNKKSISFIDSLFISTTSVCVTGLTTAVVAEQFTVLGQFIIMCLIQIGGLGLMAFLVLLLTIMGRKINLSERILLKESLNLNNFNHIILLLRRIFKYTIIFEIIGAFFMSTQFIPEYGLYKGIFYSIFHSISAFCNAGVDILGNNSLINYSNNPVISLTIMFLIIIGGLGFTVWEDISNALKKRAENKLSRRKLIKELTLHTKLVIITTVLLLITGTIFIYCFEYNNITTIANDSNGEKLLKSAFQSTTLRTAGFYTINQNEMTTISKLISICYMFIGGSPGSTAGGIKNVTSLIILLLVITYMKDKEKIHIFKKTIPESAVRRAIVVFALSIFIVIIATIALLLSETFLKEESLSSDLASFYTISFMDVIYEVVSAFATVGLTLGITPGLSTIGKVIIIILMIIGRLRTSNNIYCII